jgi:hypothetical protein
VGSTTGFVPDVSMAAKARTAVCWNGNPYRNRNRPGAAFCTYKDIDPAQCVGGTNIGVKYRAVRVR